MKINTLIVTLIVGSTLVSCVSSKKYQALNDKFGKLNSDLLAAQMDAKACRDEKAEAARKRAFVMIQELRNHGFVVEQSYGDRGLKGAMKAADKSGARFSIVLGDAELSTGSVELKDMATGQALSVTLSALATTLAEKSR